MNLNYKILGEGEPVVILHGLFGMLDNWQSMAKKLAEHYMVILLDQRDHGRSPHTDDFSYPLLAEDLRTFMEDQWIYSAHIIGHSMGGKTAMQFAMLYPDMVHKLIIVDIAPVTYEPSHDGIFEALLAVDISTIDDRREVYKALLKKLKIPAVVHFLLKNLSRNKNGSYRWKMNLELLYRKYDDILGGPEIINAFEGPALFIKGERSDYILPKYELNIKTAFPNARLVTIENSGHWVHADQPENLFSEINLFLGSR